MKRAIDFTVGLIGLITLALLAPVIAFLIKLDSKGPALFSQVRVGKDERPFRCYKFRTMSVDAPERPTHEVSSVHVTRIGHWLRISKLDELPQLINVLRGELSLVGPRPCLPSQVELIKRRRELGVSKVLPGITGLAQVRGFDMSDPHRLSRTDAEYIERQSTALDLQIMYATIFRRAAKRL